MRRFVLCLFALLPLMASAQRLKINQGDFEASGSGIFDQSQLGVEFRMGTFVDKYLQLGGQFGWHDTDFSTRSSLGAYMFYLYETKTYLLPFIGGSLGLGSLEVGEGSNKTGVEITFFFGLKYFLADNVALNTEVGLGLSTEDTFMSDNKAESTELKVRIGISYLW